MIRNLLANLGFVFQFAGIFIVLNALFALYLGEEQESISFFLTSSIFLAIGFLLNTFSERKELNLKSSFILLFISFLGLSVVGSIPYLYLRLFGDIGLESFINSLFESTSGFTTTGFTLLKNVKNLPASLIFYRSLTQFIGGLGIVYILLTFLFPDNSLLIHRFSKIFGLKEKLSRIKSLFSEILIIYFVLTLISSLLLYFLVFRNIFDSVVFSMSAIATGGFSPFNSFAKFNTLSLLIMCIPMLLGAINFKVYIKPRNLEKDIKNEILGFIFLLVFLMLLLSRTHGNLRSSIFHAISTLTTSGYQTSEFYFTDFDMFVLSIFMFIGGMSLSTSGGFKIYRVIYILKSIPTLIKNIFSEKKKPVEHYPFLLFTLYFLLVTISSLILLTYGFSFADSIFETISAISTTGLTKGLISGFSAELKLLFIFLMILGRIEIIPFFAIFLKSNKEI